MSGHTSAVDACPCGQQDAKGRALLFEACCGRWLQAPAPDAAALMRSRYSAFARGDAAYLIATWHASTRPVSLTLEPGLRWLGLEVRDHQVTGVDLAEVEFVARSRPAGARPAHRLHERSRFVREDGRWYYLNGEMF